MSHAGFVHLRVHSAYSLSEGAITIKDLVKRCRSEGMPAVAVTDSGNLFGALEFALTAKEAGVQPIVGAQLEIRPDRGAGPGDNGTEREDPAWIVLLVQDETGYRNLLRLVSRSYLENDPGERAHITYDRLAGHTEGLIALTGGAAGPIGRLLLQGQDPAAEELLDRLATLFPGRLYVELQRHGAEDEAVIEDRLIDLAYAKDLPLVATNEAFFPHADLFEAHDALLCIAGSTTVADDQRRRLTPEHRLKTADEMRVLFADLPEAVANTLVVARRCAYFPDRIAPILPAFPTEAGRSEAEELAVRGRRRAWSGAWLRPSMTPRRTRRRERRRPGRTVNGSNTSWASSARWAMRATSSSWPTLFSGRTMKAFRWGRDAARVPGRWSPGR
jgi:DNA polymerase-3 subunit alpha